MECFFTQKSDTPLGLLIFETTDRIPVVFISVGQFCHADDVQKYAGRKGPTEFCRTPEARDLVLFVVKPFAGPVASRKCRETEDVSPVAIFYPAAGGLQFLTRDNIAPNSNNSGLEFPCAG